MSKNDAMNKKFEALKGEAEFWKSQFMRLVDILIQGCDLKDDTLDHIKKILGEK